MFKQKISLEKQLFNTGLLIFLLVAGLVFACLLSLQASLLTMLTVMLLLVPFGLYLGRLYQQLLDPFYRLTSQVEAIRLEDYSLRMQSRFQMGIARELVDEINNLAEQLQQRKSRYDQHVFLIYRLIEQLDTPILVFDAKDRLSHGNQAFSEWCHRPWQTLKGTMAEELGLSKEGQNWRLLDKQQGRQWQIKHSQFHQQDGRFQLLILTNIEKELSAAEQQAWHRLIRVLSHEINNSLTPIKSLAQALADMPEQGERAKQALGVIGQRSQSLQDFVERYATLSREIKLNPSSFSSAEFANKLKSLNPQANIEIKSSLPQLWGDPTLLEQVMINLVKNALEASEQQQLVQLIFEQVGNQQQMLVIDKGQGIQNPDNLFVPFYTTKANGQGIGLAFCRNIVEQHGGQLSLSNNPDGIGARARVVWPSQGEQT